ncbi:MAG: hypothetical protein EA345_06355 [Halomonas sp.]|nr:hypothetical protein [Halomonas sp.]TVP49674.1 MAG: hypothetical protein EA345_06355 [Halomonas sp.]
MAVYGGIQAHELERWLNALTNAAYDRRCPLVNVHGGNARARTARQNLLLLAHDYRGGLLTREESASALGRWCQTYLSEAEWYVLVGTRQPPSHPQGEAALSEKERSLSVLKQHRVG